MDIIKAILAHIQKPEAETKETAPEGACPICWGRQQYDGKIRTILEDKQIDINNHSGSYEIIQEFVKTNIDGFTLKEKEITDCTTCASENKKE